MRHLIIVLAALAVPTGVLAASLPDDSKIAAGKNLSEKLCSSCHAVTSQGTDAAPSFSSIAAKDGADQVHAVLLKPHGKMPPVDLTNEQIDAIAAYIGSLKK